MHSLTLLLTKLALQIDVTHVTATIKDKEECYTENTKAALMYKANIFKLKKNYDASLEIYLQVLSTWGKNQHIYSQIAYCYLKLSRISEAITWLESFLLYKKNRSIYLLLAQCYQHAGDHQQAGEAYNTLLQEYPGYGSAYISAISYYISLNEAEEVSRYHKQFFTYCAEYKDRARVTAMVKRYQSMTSQEQAKNPPILEEFLETDLTQDEFNEENYDEHFPNTLNAKNDHFSVDYRQSCSDAKISEISMFTARHAKSDRGMTDMRPLADSTCITVVPGVGFSNKPGVV